jgi:hypothetical protein
MARGLTRKLVLPFFNKITGDQIAKVCDTLISLLPPVG